MYNYKLKMIQEEMLILSEKSSRMCKKAIKLQRVRQEDELKEGMAKRQIQEQEQLLAAKVVPDAKK